MIPPIIYFEAVMFAIGGAGVSLVLLWMAGRRRRWW
jgi:hypothetical protein